MAVLDGWRPFQVQAALFNQVCERNKLLFPNLLEADIIKLSAESAARPSESLLSPYPHSTGGSLDVTLMDLEGRLVRMGTGFDEFSDYTPTRYYEAELERGRRLSLTAIEALQNRRVRFHVMRSCGFTNYHKEWWHFDFGNQPWAIQEDTIAKYGKASLPAAL